MIAYLLTLPPTSNINIQTAAKFLPTFISLLTVLPPIFTMLLPK